MRNQSSAVGLHGRSGASCEQLPGSSPPDTPTDHMDTLASAAAEKVQQATEQAGDIAEQMADQSREAGRMAQEVAGNLKNAVDL